MRDHETVIDETQLTPADNGWVRQITADWLGAKETPLGGYLAALALRAALAAALPESDWPVSVRVDFLKRARLGETLLVPERVAEGSRAESIEVSVQQSNVEVARGTSWFLNSRGSGSTTYSMRVKVPPLEGLPTLDEIFDTPMSGIARNLVERPVGDERGGFGRASVFRAWYEFPATGSVPIANALRSLILADYVPLRAVLGATDVFGADPRITTLSLNVQFCTPLTGDLSNNLFCIASSPGAGRGIVGGLVYVYDESGSLVAVGMQQCLIEK